MLSRTSKMKILIVTGVYPPNIGGPATFFQQLKKKFENNNHDVIVFTWSDKKFDEQNVNYVKLSQNSSIRAFKTILQLLILMSRSDIVVMNNLEPYVFLCNIFFRRNIIQRIVHDDVWERARRNNWISDSIDDFQTKKYGFRIGFLRWLNRLIVKNSSQIIVPSYYLKNLVANWGINSNRIKVIYNNIDNSFKCNLTREQAKKRLNLDGRIILSVGRLVNWKGFDELIELMPQLIKKGKNTKLLIIGDGPDKEKLNKLIKNLDLTNNVRIIGKIDHKDLPLYYRACDLFVLNSEYEGYSHVLLEAAKIDCKIVARNIGGNKEFKRNFSKNRIILFNKLYDLI